MHTKPTEDLDELHRAAWSAVHEWRETIKPFQVTEFQFVENEMARMGAALTEPYDQNRPAREAKRRQKNDRFKASLLAMGDAWRAWHEDRLDAVASGW